MKINQTIADQPLAEILRRSPSAVRVLAGFGMACPGCPMASFETPREAARAYKLSLEKLVAALDQTLKGVSP